MERSPELSRFLDERIVGQRVAPAAVAGLTQLDASGQYVRTVGTAGAATVDSVFDLASVTKPFVALTVARLVEQGRLTWTTALAELLPEVAEDAAAVETVEALLSHRAGLVAHLELFADSWRGLPVDPRLLLRRAAGAKRADGGRDALYSDLGYLLVGAGLVRRFGMALDDLVTRELLAPLGLSAGSARMWLRLGDFAERVAPTEVQRGRGGLIRGQVHDDNAWALGGSGLCGHAGLFGTLPALLHLGEYLLEGAAGRGPLGKIVPFLSAPRPGGSLRLGFDGVSGAGSLAGPGSHERVFGHLGFTGTSLWCDPERSVATVLLTNRVHPSRDNPKIRGARLATQEFLWRLGRPAENLARGLDA